MTKFSTIRRFAGTPKIQAYSWLCALACLLAPSALADMQSNAQSASDSLGRMDQALSQAAAGHPELLNRITAQRILNNQARQNANQLVKDLNSTEAPVSLPSNKASAAIAPAYAQPALPTPTPKPAALDATQILPSLAVPKDYVDGLSFPRARANATQEAAVKPTDSGTALAVEAERALASESPRVTPAPVAAKPTYRIPHFDANMDALIGVDKVTGKTESETVAAWQLNKETSGRRNAVARLTASLSQSRGLVEDRAAETAPQNFRPTWYQRSSASASEVANYMKTNRVARGSFQSAPAVSIGARAVVQQTFRRDSKTLVGVAHDTNLRSSEAAATPTAEPTLPPISGGNTDPGHASNTNPGTGSGTTPYGANPYGPVSSLGSNFFAK